MGTRYDLCNRVMNDKWVLLPHSLDYSKISLLRPPKIKTTSPLRPVIVSPKWYFPCDIIFNIKTTSLIRPLLGSPKGGLNIGILL